MRKFELNSINELVKVGDTISDIKEAINGGITAIGVLKVAQLLA